MMEGMTHESKDGTTSSANLYRIVAATHRVLSAHASKIDTLNVYPVPDGDTARTCS
jgi:dihydroxyacetone kinase-like predicted kinase